MTNELSNQDKDVIYKQIANELGKSKADIDRDISILQEWLKTQPHLPEVPGVEIIQSFLLFNKFSIERTKQKLDMYYTIRSFIPELFERHPCSPEMILQARITYVIPLPRLSTDSRRIIFSKFSEEYGPESFSFDKFLCHVLNVFEVMLRENLFLGAHFIFDCAGCKLGHITKVSPTGLKKLSVVMEKVFSNRVASINIINYHPIVETSINLAKTLLPEKVRSRMKVHKDTGTLYEAFSKENLPKDIGGREDSLEELTDCWVEKMKSYKALFDKLTKMRVDESKRPTKLVNDDILGFYGNFKKLDVD